MTGSIETYELIAKISQPFVDWMVSMTLVVIRAMDQVGLQRNGINPTNLPREGINPAYKVQ